MVKTSRFVTPVLMWTIVIIGVLIIFNYIEDEQIFKQNLFSYLLFAVALIYWLYFFISSLGVHKEAVFSASKISRVVKSGVYGKVRHPIYSSDIILGIGIFFLFPYLKVLISVIWLILVLFIWMKLEENALIQKFGDEYRNYKKEVPMVIPKFFKK